MSPNVMSGHYYPSTGKTGYVGIIAKYPTVSNPQILSSGKKKRTEPEFSSFNTLIYKLSEHRKSFNIPTPPFPLL